LISSNQNKIFASLFVLFILLSSSLIPAFASAPSAPTGLTTSSISTTEIDLSWSASTVNSGVIATGGTITTVGANTIHTFTSSGTYKVTKIGSSPNIKVLVIAGGGGSGANGGGGAGGYQYNPSFAVTVQNYTVTIGAGGAGSTSTSTASSGGNSVFGSITSTGGGGGSSGGAIGGSGGSGGGGSGQGSTHTAGSGTGGQGNKGGTGTTAANNAGGGGGGSGGAGQNATASTGGNGGAGTSNSISGSSVTYAGGGGGATNGVQGTANGGGGDGKFDVPANNGQANTGGGEGATTNSFPSGNGGSGVVIVSEVGIDPPLRGYKIERSTDGSSWSTIVANTTTTSTTYSDTGLSVDTQYYYRVSGLNSDGSSSASSVASNATKPNPPTSLTATPASATQINLSWSAPSGTIRGYKIERESPVGGGFSVIVANTTTSATSYSNTGLTSGTQYNYRVTALGKLGSISSPSNTASQYPWSKTTGNVRLANQTVGDVIQINGTFTLSVASPTPVIIKNAEIYANGTLAVNKNINQNITLGQNYNTTLWYQFPDSHNKSLKVIFHVTNFTGTVNENTIAINSSSSVKARQFGPSYLPALDPSQGTVNYTVNRNAAQSFTTLTINRDKNGATFPLECLWQTATQAQFNSGGFWRNASTVGYGYFNASTTPTQIYYITCYNSGLLFTTTSYFNGSAALFGISAFDNTFGAFLGVPVGVFFVVMAASLGNRRTAPMWVVIILAIAGMMATIGFFTLDQNVWYMAIIAGLLGLFVGRKLF